jgi:nitrite reductase/ring-hydroxylating ferredoxin subunit
LTRIVVTQTPLLLCRVADLPDPGTFEFAVGEGDWPLKGFVVHFNGQLRAYVNSCPHARLPLNFKPNDFFALFAPLLHCAVHGAMFAPLTGECVAGPCVGRQLRCLDIEVVSGHVYLRGPMENLSQR